MSRISDRDAALEVLLLALEGDEAPADAGGRVGFLRARAHPGLVRFGERLECVQDFKPEADALEAAGLSNSAKLAGKFSLVLLLPDRQKEQTLADLARGMDLLDDGGTLVVSLHNDWGAKRFEKHLAELAGEVQTMSKRHCRAFWALRSDVLDAALLKEWIELGEPRRIADDRFWSKPGLFSWHEVDGGSQLLAEHLPATMHGRVADLGASWGFLSDFVLRKYPLVERLDVVEADRTALECARRNLSGINGPAKVQFHWEDVTKGVGANRYDFVVMNAPFHEGRQADPLLGLKFIAAAGSALKPGGELWLVANRHLPYERQLSEGFAESAIVVQTGGYKVLKAIRGETFPAR